MTKTKLKFDSLVLKFRPQTFTEFAKGGNEKIVKMLKYGIETGQLRHGYIFYGETGLGKTSLARIFARVLNCEDITDDLEPCNECVTCKAILKNAHQDVLEIDGASNRGIDQIRELQGLVTVVPATNVKVFIIEEAHALTSDAWRALLKTLEEPNNRVIFILTTTDPLKIPDNIHGRCMPFEFQPYLKEKIYKVLRKICKKEKIQFTKDGLKLLAISSNGLMRNIQRNLEMARDLGNGKITRKVVQELLGISEDLRDMADKTFKLMLKGDTQELNNLLWKMPTKLDSLKEFIGIIIEKAEQVVIKKRSERGLLIIDELLLLIKDLFSYKEIGLRKVIHAGLICITARIYKLKR